MLFLHGCETKAGVGRAGMRLHHSDDFSAVLAKIIVTVSTMSCTAVSVTAVLPGAVSYKVM